MRPTPCPCELASAAVFLASDTRPRAPPPRRRATGLRALPPPYRGMLTGGNIASGPVPREVPTRHRGAAPDPAPRSFRDAHPHLVQVLQQVGRVLVHPIRASALQLLRPVAARQEADAECASAAGGEQIPYAVPDHD